jgi:hypothetical protein
MLQRSAIVACCNSLMISFGAPVRGGPPVANPAPPSPTKKGLAKTRWNPFLLQLVLTLRLAVVAQIAARRTPGTGEVGSVLLLL